MHPSQHPHHMNAAHGVDPYGRPLPGPGGRPLGPGANGAMGGAEGAGQHAPGAGLTAEQMQAAYGAAGYPGAHYPHYAAAMNGIMIFNTINQ